MTIGPDDDHYLSEPDIMKMKVVELKAACTERHQLTTGNKAHLRHRLLRLCRHIPWATPPPPGGTRAERAAGSFHAPGHADYGVNEFIITTGVTGGNIAYDKFKRMILWMLTFAEQGVCCMEYGLARPGWVGCLSCMVVHPLARAARREGGGILGGGGAPSGCVRHATAVLLRYESSGYLSSRGRQFTHSYLSLPPHRPEGEPQARALRRPDPLPDRRQGLDRHHRPQVPHPQLPPLHGQVSDPEKNRYGVF